VEVGHKGGKSRRAGIRGQEGRRWQGRGRKGLRYDSGITSVGSWLFDEEKYTRVHGCFNAMPDCFLLIFLLFISFVTYFLLLKGVRFVTFCYFFTVCNFHKLLFIVEKGQGLYSIHCVTGENVHFDFFPYFFLLLRGRGVEVNVFFFLHLTCGRRKGKG
jgi:hypothetical protein